MPAAPIVRPANQLPPARVSLAMPRYKVPVGSQVVALAKAPVPDPLVAPPAASPPEQFVDVEFQYTGSGRLTVTGPVTGTVYYFSAGSESIAVHGADAPSLVSVPGLKIFS